MILSPVTGRGRTSSLVRIFGNAASRERAAIQGVSEVEVKSSGLPSSATGMRADGSSAGFRAAVYAGAFVTGAIVMSFEMLGSRYLNPYFGSGIYTWASLISTVLAALTAGYFAGGRVADRYPSARVLGAAVLIGSTFILVLPSFSTMLLEALLEAIDDIKAGSLASAFVLMFFPVAFYG